MPTAIFLDTETTRKASKPGEPPIEVVELAWLGDDGGSFRGLFSPTHGVQWGALATHHLLPSDLAGRPPSATAISEIPPAMYWIGHNIDFDWTALGEPAGPMRICTLALARQAYPDCDSYSLGALMYYVFGANEQTRTALREAHSALADVVMCSRLYRAIAEKLGIEHTDFAEMYAASEDARVPRVWPFGKFEGQPIEAADRGYAGWFSRTCTDRPDYGYYMVALRRAGLVR